MIAGASYTSATIILQLAALNNEGFVYQPWHVTLLMIAVAGFGTFVNTFGSRKLPLLEGIILCLHIFGFFAIIIPLQVQTLLRLGLLD